MKDVTHITAHLDVQQLTKCCRIIVPWQAAMSLNSPNLDMEP